MAASYPPPPPRRRRRIRTPVRWALVALAVGVMVIVVVFSTVNVSMSKSFSFGNDYSGATGLNFFGTEGEAVCEADAWASFTLTVNGGLDIRIDLEAPNGALVWESSSSMSSNATVPTGDCGTYLFNWNGTGVGSFSVDGAFTYEAPFL
jgi:hypothetical protein